MLKLNINTSHDHVTVFFVSVCGAVLKWEGLYSYYHIMHDVVNTLNDHMIPGGGTGAAAYSGGCGRTNEGR